MLFILREKLIFFDNSALVGSLSIFGVSRGRALLVFHRFVNDLSFLRVIPLTVALLTHSPSVVGPCYVLTVLCVVRSAVLLITLVAHALGVVLLLGMWANGYNILGGGLIFENTVAQSFEVKAWDRLQIQVREVLLSRRDFVCVVLILTGIVLQDFVPSVSVHDFCLVNLEIKGRPWILDITIVACISLRFLLKY